MIVKDLGENNKLYGFEEMGNELFYLEIIMKIMKELNKLN